MSRRTFYLNSKTLSVYSGENGRGHLYVPAGAIISIDSEDLDTALMVDVLWNDQKLQMFAQDIRDRADRIDSTDLPAEISLIVS